MNCLSASHTGVRAGTASAGRPALQGVYPRHVAFAAAQPPRGQKGVRAAATNSSSGGPGDAPLAGRRQALLSAAAVAGTVLVPQVQQLIQAAPVFAAEDVPVGLKQFADKTLAYSFMYPVATASGQPLSMILTRPPEKYSSAAPLSADARQRIVSELFDLRKFVTVSVTVGPSSGVLKDQPQESWKPRDVALTVLIDRSTARLSSGQRTALNNVEESHKEERDGQTFYIYEHTSQGSPTSIDRNKETYRHAVATTTVRPGLNGSPYLYTLNLSCPEPLWEDLEPQFKVAIDSFKLLPTTRDYIAPDKDPFIFW